MGLWIQRGKNGFVRPAIGNVVHTLSALVLYDVALEIDLCQIHRRQQESHAIGIEPESQRQRVRGQCLVVVGPVFGGRSIVVGAGRLKQLIERAHRNML